ncbi:MAG: cytochrome c1 [Rhodobacterales bacterium]|nr:MAG: cytochrome c1 [Rhodobacterales bacterium]
MSIKKIAVSALFALSFATNAAVASGDAPHIHDVDFSFEGPFGTFDEAQLRRGLQIYTEVCSSCHGMVYVPIRTLTDEGGPHLPAEYVREYAKQFEVADDSEEAEPGDTREAKPADHFPVGADPKAPDLSLIAKNRAGFHGPYGTGINQLLKGIGGPEHIVGILTGYTGEEKEEAGTLFYENTAFPGGWIAMPPPLSGEDVEFEDGHSNELHHEAEDIAAFLMWAAEPKMMDRKHTGFVAMILLAMMTVLLYATNKRLWAPIKKRAKEASS